MNLCHTATKLHNVLLFLSILGLTLAAPLNHRIVGGAPIDISEVPYQIAVGNYSSFWCGGSIIDKRWILTAAHCFNDNDINNEKFLIFVGMTNNKISGIEASMMRDVKKVYVHEEFIPATFYKDIAILELVDDLQFNDKAQPVKLPHLHEEVPYGKLAFASGWGKLASGGSPPDQLQGVSLELLRPSPCSPYGHFDETYMQCAGFVDGTVDTCQGDSGGPLVYNGVIYGVVSFGTGSATPGFPGVYTHVPNLRDYISSITGL